MLPPLLALSKRETWDRANPPHPPRKEAAGRPLRADRPPQKGEEEPVSGGLRGGSRRENGDAETDKKLGVSTFSPPQTEGQVQSPVHACEWTSSDSLTWGFWNAVNPVTAHWARPLLGSSASGTTAAFAPLARQLRRGSRVPGRPGKPSDGGGTEGAARGRQGTRNSRPGAGRVCEERCFSRAGKETRRRQHCARTVGLLCEGVRGGAAPREGAAGRGEKSSILRPARTAGPSAVCGASSHSH